MSWTEVKANQIKEGDFIQTPHGKGTVERVSHDGSARVKVNGQLFEVQAGDMQPVGDTPSGGQPDGQPQPNGGEQPNGDDFKPGDTVTSKKKGGDWRVTKVQERGVWAQPTKGGQPLRFRRDDLKLKKQAGTPDEDTPDEKPQPQGEFKPGDIITGKPNNGYGITTEHAKMEVLSVHGERMRVKVLEHKTKPHDVDYETSVSSSPDRFEKIDEEKAKEETTNEVTSGEKEVDTVTQTGDGLSELFKLKEYLEKKIETDVEGELKDLKDAVEATKKLEIVIGETSHILKGKKHAQLETLITYSALRMNTLLVGMAGTGKTHAGEQVAEALGLAFYSMSVGAQTSKSDIIGYMDANGNYVKTFFRDAYENGGVFLMDEIDAGNANVLIQVNAALSNGLCAFPDKMVTKHDDFVFIASANTYGNGANRQYVGRNQLDAATLDRFTILDWKIDNELEEALAIGRYGAAWYKTVRATRDFVAEKNIRALVSPRATQKGSRLLASGIHVSEVINAVLLGSVPEDKKADIIQLATRVYDGAASAIPSEVNAEVSELIREDVPAEMPF